MRRQRRPAADSRSDLPRPGRSLYNNGLGPDGVRALAPALEKMVGLKELGCAANTARQPTLAQNLPRRARSVFNNGLGPDGARALVPTLEKMVGLKRLLCVANCARQPTPAQISPNALDPPAVASASSAMPSQRSKPRFQRDVRWTVSDSLRHSIGSYNDLGGGRAAIKAAVPGRVGGVALP